MIRECGCGATVHDVDGLTLDAQPDAFGIWRLDGTKLSLRDIGRGETGHMRHLVTPDCDDPQLRLFGPGAG